ncbi:MAG: 30S ribosomal protein S6 [Candidatus Latescibacter sp.]|nr:30S ribosomal protein S6 [Candidatus Latescibacter sp.]
MRKYDTTFIIDGTIQEAAREAIIERFTGILQKLGAEIDQIVRWGQRTMAYEMKKRTHGYYVIFYYHAEPSMIAAFERDLRLHENILRFMTLIYEGKHPEYIRDEGAGMEISSAHTVKNEPETDLEEPDLSVEDEESEEYLEEETDTALPVEDDETEEEKEKE